MSAAAEYGPMDNLVLAPGPLLLWRDLHREDSERPVATDVGERAIEFLFEPVTLDERLTLGDVFRLLEQCPVLQQVFRRDFARELCAEARKGPLPPSRGSDPEEVAGIEHLELCWSWQLDTGSGTYSGVHHLDLYGIGHVLEADAPAYGVDEGGRIRWSVSLVPLRELLDLPLRLRDTFDVTEDDIDAKAYGGAIASGKCQEVLLGQVIHGILWELSFHGGPEGQAEFRADLMARIAEADAGATRMIPADEVFSQFEKPGFDALFESVSGVSHAEVRRALRSIAGHEQVGPCLDRQFQGKVVVRAPFRSLPGREFRRALRAAGR